MWPAVHSFASQGKLDEVKEELKKKDTANAQLDDGTTPLYLAAQVRN